MADEEDEKYYVPNWEQLSAGVYTATGGRFKITRRGPGTWILTDNDTRDQLRFDLLRDAQRRAERILNENEETSRWTRQLHAACLQRD